MIRHFDTTIPNSARIWNYWMGGKDHYDADRQAGDAYRAIAPQIVTMAHEAREYLNRAVTLLAGDLGVRQFLDVGTGLPAADNTHEVAQRVSPAAQIVYVDNDPIVLAHARALFISTREGRTASIDADLHDPEKILTAAHGLLDFSQPVALMLMGVLGHVQDHTEATAIVRRLQADLPVGSYFVHYDGTDTDPGLAKAQAGYNTTGALPYVLRSPTQLEAFYDGLELLEPGIVSCPLWRPAPESSPEPTHIYGGIGRKQSARAEGPAEVNR
ncbi:SAM-dependent methyltransferase [Streptomyces sp. NPDC006655]|uniref:SAM-dependent methyltransferase n=1 Tax=Streptomyces sp. NPDC006655 TaxID=3156898 RepID=UPI003456F7C1